MSAWPASPPFVILIQDLSYAEFLEQASLIADRLVFPFWFRRIPVCFFSWLSREAYETQPIKGEDLHRDVSRVIRALLAEQVLTLLERSNYQLASPDLLVPGTQKTLFTPIEEKMRTALEAHNLPYQPQVRLGRQVVDFLVEVQNSRVIVECESKAYHEPSKDPEPEQGPVAGGISALQVFRLGDRSRRGQMHPDDPGSGPLPDPARVWDGRRPGPQPAGGGRGGQWTDPGAGSGGFRQDQDPGEPDPEPAQPGDRPRTNPGAGVQ